MKYALALFESKQNDIQTNLKTIETVLMTAAKQRVDLVLFGEQFLQGYRPDDHLALDINSSGIFTLRLLASNYDIRFGVGFIELVDGDVFNSYVVFDKDGSKLAHHRYGVQSESFKIDGQSYQVVIGDEGFSISKPVDDLILWPTHLEVTPKEWFNEALMKYRLQCANLSDEVILVNVFSEKAFGGGFYLKDQKFILNQPMEQMGLSIFEG